MKNRILTSILAVSLFSTVVSGQNQCSKGHFIFGSDLIQYSTNNSSYRYTSGSHVPDSNKTSSSDLSFGIGVWAGYFVSNRFCVGLDYSFHQPSMTYYYSYYPYYYNYSPSFSIFPSNLFFRYYLVKADSGQVLDLALEGNAGFQYNSSMNSYYEDIYNNQTSTITNQMNFMNLNSGIKLLFSFHISKHFALQLAGGFNLGYESIDFVSSSITPSYPSYTFIPAKETYLNYGFSGSFRLQFYL